MTEKTGRKLSDQELEQLTGGALDLSRVKKITPPPEEPADPTGSGGNLMPNSSGPWNSPIR